MASNRYRWYVVGIGFTFMLLHQADELLIGPLLTDIRATFHLSESQAGAIGTGALIVSAVLYPIWGYLYDRYARAKLLAVASGIWGVTTWFGAIAPTFPTFMAARASTGIDDSSYPGLYSLISDYFAPGVRGKIYGLLQLTNPIGYMLGLVLALGLGPIIGWRNVFLLTGTLGVILAVIIFTTVRDQPRGNTEPELADLGEFAAPKFNWAAARALFRKRTLIPLFIQGFFGVFPLNIISFWFFDYLKRERSYSDSDVLPTMAIAVLAMAAGAFVGGLLGDALFKRMPRGRLIVATLGVFSAAFLMVIALNIPIDNKPLFGIFLTAAAFFVLFSGPNVASTIYDITVPEVRSTALAIQYFVESFGAASAPFLVGLLAERIGTLGQSILIISLFTYVMCGIFLIGATLRAPVDIHALRVQLQERADAIRAEIVFPVGTVQSAAPAEVE